MGVIDIHCHLNDERLAGKAENIVGNFEKDEIEACVCVGYDMPSSECACALSGKYAEVYCAVGVHPHDSKSVKPEDYDKIAKLSENPKTVAIGEIGLDYFYDLSPREEQLRVFSEQLELADALKLPVILHIRDAYEDARKILFDNKRYLNSGLLLHCYSGSAEFVKIFGALDAYYSFGGAITFKNAKRNIDALLNVPLDRLTLETDCPYMTPTPFRGQTNVPAYIKYVLEKAAEVRALDKDELSEITTKNANIGIELNMNTYAYEFEGNLYLNITNRCPNSCEFCVRNFKDGVGENKLWLNREPTYEDLLEVLSLYDLKKYGEVVFCGFGEPMCALNLISQIGPYLKRKGVETRINTNGLGNLINKRDDVAKLIAPYIDNVSISLNASNPEDYDAICKSKFGKEAFDAMLRFAKDCVAAGIHTTVTVVDFVGEDEIAACAKLAEQAGAHFRVRATIHEDDEY